MTKPTTQTTPFKNKLAFSCAIVGLAGVLATCILSAFGVAVPFPAAASIGITVIGLYLTFRKVLTTPQQCVDCGVTLSENDKTHFGDRCDGCFWENKEGKQLMEEFEND